MRNCYHFRTPNSFTMKPIEIFRFKRFWVGIFALRTFFTLCPFIIHVKKYTFFRYFGENYVKTMCLSFTSGYKPCFAQVTVNLLTSNTEKKNTTEPGILKILLPTVRRSNYTLSRVLRHLVID